MAAADRTPLLNNSRRPRDEEEVIEYYEEEEDWAMSPNVKYSLYTLGAIATIGFIYLFAFYLPQLFIPESREIEGIVKVGELGSSLVPISSKRVKELGMNSDISNLDIEIDAEIQAKKSNEVERLIFVGDIHGHYVEFRKLLRQVKFNPETDHLLVMGDFITKGPDSLKVLDYLIDHDIDCIFGNHEYYVMNNYATFHGLKSPYFMNETNEMFSIKDGGFNSDPEFLLAKKLQPKHIKYINQCTIIKKLGQVPFHKFNDRKDLKVGGDSKSLPGYAVHAGLRWDLSIEDQEPIECLEMRSYIGPNYNETTDDPDTDNAVSWSKIWNSKQKIAAKEDAKIIYYGHEARRGLNLRKYSKGLDSGCDGGGKLSAMVIWLQEALNSKGKPVTLYREQVHQVSCK